ncbi:MAG: DMT family transporter [Sulfurospirillaceae bacterium]|nr:DMT family transporter [Sulfurospirillaceae bacterium]MDD2825331.1 DMT family transporter [Sulfurospirillaceae bacterium]
MANKNLFFFLLFISMIAWGGSWVNVKIISNYINAYEMMFIRFFITVVAMVPMIMVLKKSFRIDAKSFGLAVMSALVMIAYMNYYFLGTKFGTASLGGAMVTTLIPINTFILMAILQSKKISKKDAFALTLGAIGVLTMLHVWSLDVEHIFVIQNFYFLVASVLWAFMTIISSKATKVSPIIFTFYMYVVMVVCVWIFSINTGVLISHTYDQSFWLNMLSMSILSTAFANTIFFLGIEKLGAAEVSSFMFLVPFSAIILSAIFLGETISISIVIGTILTLVSVKMLNNIKIMQKKAHS